MHETKMKISTYPLLADYLPRVSNNCAASGGYRLRNNIEARSDLPLVSIVTVTFNAAKTLPNALKSVREQTYKNIEHIIIDGGSTDETLDLIKSCETSISLWRSESDEGIYDAFNKGVALAAGEFIGILNADDYYEADQIEMAVSALMESGAPFVHGDILLHGWQGKDVELLGDPHYELKIRERMPSLHQVTTLCRRFVFEKFGLFSTRYKIAGDFDWYLRLAKNNVIGIHEPRVRSHMTAGGISTTQQRRALWEVMLVIWRHGLPLSRAICLTLPRLIFPNGIPSLLSCIKKRRT